MRISFINKNRKRGAACALALLFLLAGLPGASPQRVLAAPEAGAVSYLPYVTAEMTDSDYWLRNDPEADVVLADPVQISALNYAMVREKACNMYDLRHAPGTVAAGVPESLAKSAEKSLASYTKSGYFTSSGAAFSPELAAVIAGNCRNAAYDGTHIAQYGIAVRRTDLRAFPTEEIITDEQGDVNFDYAQNSSVRVNEPMVIQSVSADGRYYYGYTSNCPGWVLVEDVALCSGRDEWLSAWDLPSDRLLVVAASRIMMEESNTDPDVSSVVLTQGTVLELANGPGVPEMVTNRSRQYNYTVFVPVRTADGRWSKKAALISMHHDVHAGYLPLTKRNILRVAFNMLGDTYGWGGMLGSEDCSGYIRGVYRCFGLELPRNTTWQAKAPAARADISSMTEDEKKIILDMMPAGTTLFFSGHEMMYLGQENGNYYVISSVSSAVNPFGPGLNRMRLRSVVINTLDIKRMNGRTWLDNLHTALVPWQAN